MTNDAPVYHDYRPEAAIPPGETLSACIEARGGNRAWLSIRSGISRRRIQALAEGKADITGDDARRLADALGGSVSFWLELRINYRSAVARLAQSSGEIPAQSTHKPISPSVPDPLHSAT